MSNFQQVKLKNGTRVVFVPHGDTAAATILALYEVGSRYEPSDLSGAAHFIEHMMFKGTKNRPDTMTISRDLDGVGADYNAFTSKDYTGYYIRLQADKLPLAVDMLDDMLHRSLYRPKDIKSERKVIHEEIRMYEDNPVMHIDDVLEEEMFRGSTLGRKIAGTIETMNGIKRDRMMAFRDKYYVPERTVVAVAGRFDPSEVIPMLEKTFGARKARTTPPTFKTFSASKAGQKGPRAVVEHKETEQVQVAFGWPSYGHGDPRGAALRVLSTILGGNMSSRLFLEVREKAGLAYSVRASHGPYQDTGVFCIQAGLSRAKVHDAMAIMMREARKLKDKDVTNEELTRAKEYLKGRMMLDLEESSRLASYYAMQELLQHEVETPEEKIAKIMAVTKADIRAAAKDVIRRDRATVAVIGPYAKTDAPSFTRHLKSI